MKGTIPFDKVLRRLVNALQRPKIDKSKVEKPREKSPDAKLEGK